MKRYLVAIIILTLAYSAYGIELKRVMAGKPKVVVTPTAKSYLLASYSTATEWEVRRVDDTSALTAGEYRTTAADGNRGVECYNTGDMDTTGFTSEKAGTFCYNQTLQKFRYWNGIALADMGGTVTGGSSGYVTAPTYSNEACTAGQWATDGSYHYDCTATDTWNRFAYAAWSNPAASFTTINGAVKDLGAQPSGSMTPTPGGDTANSYLYYSPVTAGATGAITNAHWNMFSSGTPNAATSKFMIYNASGVLVCSSAAASGDGNTTSPGQVINATVADCTLTSGTSYLVGVCANSDGSQYNAPYFAATTSGPVTNRIQVACDGSSFTPASATQVSGTRPIFAWGDSNATR